MGILAGQVALVTGAGRGFGRAIAERLASEGARVALMARSIEQLEDVAAAIRQAGGEAVAVRCDLSSPSDIARAVAEAENRAQAQAALDKVDADMRAKRATQASITRSDARSRVDWYCQLRMSSLARWTMERG